MQPETQKNRGGVTFKGEMAGESRGLVNRPQSHARLESCKEGLGARKAAKEQETED